MEEKLQQLSNIVKSFNNVNQTFYTEVVKLTEENASLTEKNEKAYAENEELTNKLITMTEKNHRIIDEFNVISKEVKDQKQALDQREQKFNQEIENAVNDAKQEKEKEKNAEIRNLESQYNNNLSRLQETIGKQKNEIKDKDKEINNYKVVVAGKDKEIKDLKDDIANHKEIIKKRAKTIQEQQGEIDGYTAKITDKEKTITDQAKTIETQQGVISKQEKEIDGYKADIKQRDKEIEQKKEEIKGYTAKITEKETKIRTQELKINMLTANQEEPTNQPPETSTPNDTNNIQCTVREQYNMFGSENGYFESHKTTVTCEKNTTDYEMLVDDIRSQLRSEYQSKINDLKEEKKQLLEKLQESNQELENTKLKHQALINHLLTTDKWAFDDVKKVIENGLRKMSKKNDGQNNGGYNNEVNLYK